MIRQLQLISRESGWDYENEFLDCLKFIKEQCEQLMNQQSVNFVETASKNMSKCLSQIKTIIEIYKCRKANND